MKSPTSSSSLVLLTSAALLVHQAQAHAVITYPPWRGNNLLANETFPFGMARNYPCGGHPPTTNRTSWPLDGSGAFAFEPGWSPGHALNQVYINLCLGEPDEDLNEVRNCSLTIVGPLELRGPTDQQYGGTLCLPRLGLPRGVVGKRGEMASIQIVQVVSHGAALYSCADIIFTDDPAEVPPVNESICANSTGLSLKAARLVTEGDSSPSGSGAASVVAVGQFGGVFATVSGLSMVFSLLYLL